MQGDFPPARRPPMFEKINPLPRSQGEPALDYRNRELHARQRRANMGGHVVGALVRVPISRRLLGRQAFEKCLQIGVLVILIILVVGALPAWPYSTGWGYYPVGGLGTILIILLILALLGYV